jgi:hypothetical protein
MATRFAAACTLLFLVAGGVRAEPDNERIKAAIKGGQAYLRAVYRPGGPGPGGLGPGGGVPGVAIMGPLSGNGTGSIALAGLAMLESGVPPSDEAVSNIIKACREGCLSTNSTYEISLLIMLFDRLGAKADRPFIQFLTLKLLTGQVRDGSWSYQCQGLALDPVRERQLRLDLLAGAKLTSGDGARTGTGKEKPKPREDLNDGSKPKKEPKKDPPKETTDEPTEDRNDGKPRLHPALEKLVPQAVGGGTGFNGDSGDHSNTQFATVGLWCGRRHGVDVSKALAQLDKHYRDCQGSDGGWAYMVSAGSSPAMTCAGLMGLAIGFGAKNLKEGADREPRLENPEALDKDRRVVDGLKYVGDFIKAAGDLRGKSASEFLPNDLSNNLYFMWSLERVGMVYGLKTIGNVDWFDWGSNILVRTQQRDGSWRSDGFHSGSTDNATAFALLFLSRANLAADLTTSLRGKMNDPGTSRLVRDKNLDDLLKKAASPSSASLKGDSTGKRPRTDTPAKDAAIDTKLGEALVSASAGELDALVTKYKDTKGGEYTDALAYAATKLTGDGQTKVRDALIHRLTRMKAATLKDYMGDPNRELRRAAALAAGTKGTAEGENRKERLREVADTLINLTADKDSEVAQAARTSLKALTDQDFGPESGASPADRGKALLAWRQWWEGQR